MAREIPGGSCPTAQDVARRCLILRYLVITAIVTPPRGMIEALMAKRSDADREKFKAEMIGRQEALCRALREQELWEYASPTEREIFQTNGLTITPQQQIAASWRVEALQALMWALGLIDKLPPYDAKASRELVKTIPSKDAAGFVKDARLRDDREIERARSVAEFWHWRSRTRQLIETGKAFQGSPKMAAAGIRSFDDIIRISARKGAADGTFAPAIADDFPAMGKAYRDLTAEEWSQVRSITMERHFALNWLCGRSPENRWDETPTDT